MARWKDLPLEIKHMVWKLLADDARKSKNLGQHPRSDYVLVNHDWRVYFEKVNFRQLILSPTCLADLNKRVSKSKRCLVRSIWLRLELPDYDCMGLGCRFPEYWIPQGAKNSQMFTSALQKLFRALARWDPADTTQPGQGLTLELSVHSPGDSRHFFQNRTYGPFEWTGMECLDNQDEACAFRARRRVPDDPQDSHGWAYGLQLFVAGREDFERAKLRLLGVGRPDSCLDVLGKLRPVRVITGFLIRRQYHRLIAPKGLGRILQCLPSLESARYEMWRPIADITNPFPHTTDPFKRDKGHATVFRSRLPPTLKSISLLEDFDAVLHGQDGECFPRPADPSLARALANASSQLDDLAVTFLVDATDFFYTFFPATWAESQQPDWKNLRNLALTTNAMSPRNRNCQRDTTNLLEAAGKAAHRMPMLKKLEIWNAKKGEGAIFQYERSGIIKWFTSWPLNLDPGVIQVWESVALKVAGRYLTVRAGSITPPKNYGSVLHMLELKEQMLHPVSLYQIQWEVENERG